MPYQFQYWFQFLGFYKSKHYSQILVHVFFSTGLIKGVVPPYVLLPYKILKLFILLLLLIYLMAH